MRYGMSKAAFSANFITSLSKGRKFCSRQKKKFYAYGEDVFTKGHCQTWFSKFRKGNLDVEDAPHSGRPVEANEGKTKALMDANL
ncbi:hypothetical protein CDAR_617991 [Caerostris darwini]|uniref:Mos1 transposase HTH domain-containing protein n=1 Tax=Caerostris darwini TaxID=1538125 RepID=A0AAV4PXP4_9ARAC|nr:hypothetical protein CDAR_488241 [Caerostris darwini]GIY31033.1 hypothetical protein CDAR_617991 [Caerostris darwini]